MNFRILKEFLGIFNRIKYFRKDKDVNNAWAYSDRNGLASPGPWCGTSTPPTLRWCGDRLWLGRRGEERQSDRACRSQGEGAGQHEWGGGLLTWSITSEAVKAVSDGSVPVMTVLLTVGGDDEEVLWHQG
jgi:hypothetical protein